MPDTPTPDTRSNRLVGARFLIVGSVAGFVHFWMWVLGHIAERVPGDPMADYIFFKDYLPGNVIVLVLFTYGFCFLSLPTRRPATVALIGTLVVSALVGALVLRLMVLKSALPDMPEQLFAEELVIEVPDGCHPVRGTKGQLARFENSATCTFPADNRNTRWLQIRRLDLGFGEYGRSLGQGIVSAERLAAEALADDERDAARLAAGRATTTAYLTRVLEPSEVPKGFLSCIAALQSVDWGAPSEIGRDRPMPEPATPLDTERRYRCQAVYAERREVIYFSLKIRETHAPGGLSGDFETFARSIFDSVRIAPASGR